MNNRNHTKIFELIICKMYNMMCKLQDKPENNLSIEIHFIVYLMFLSTCSTKNQCTHRNRQLHEQCYSFHENLPVKILFFIIFLVSRPSGIYIYTLRCQNSQHMLHVRQDRINLLDYHPVVLLIVFSVFVFFKVSSACVHSLDRIFYT
jgi:hypothetical protein